MSVTRHFFDAPLFQVCSDLRNVTLQALHIIRWVKSKLRVVPLVAVVQTQDKNHSDAEKKRKIVWINHIQRGTWDLNYFPINQIQ